MHHLPQRCQLALTVAANRYTADYNSLTASVPLAADSKVSDLPNHLSRPPSAFDTAPAVLQYCQGLGALSTQAAAADVGTLNEVPSDAVT